MLDTDEGARFLGEVAFGLNDEIQVATGETLFDEKIGGTCHIALGMAFPEAGGTNPSGVHWDWCATCAGNPRCLATAS